MRFSHRFLLISFHLLLICSSSICASPLSDIPSVHWAKDAVETLAAKGFVTGFSPEVFRGERPATRYETATILTRLVVFLDRERPYVSPAVLQELKDKLADYQDEIDRLGMSIGKLEDKTASLESRVDKLDRIRSKGEFHNRTVASGITGNLGTGIGQDSTDTLTHLNRPYPLFPVQAGENSTSLGTVDISANLNETWVGGGRIAAYNSVGQSLNGLVFGGTPPLFSNPFLGYSTGNLKASLDQFYAHTADNVLTGEIGSFSPAHSPSYLFAGVPNLSVEGPDFLPNFGGRLEADMKPYFIISKAYSEIFAGKLGQASSWETQIFGANMGIELLGVALSAHWMTTQNDPANFAAGTSGMITVPINGGGGWLDPILLTPIAVGPQKEKVLGIDLSVARNYMNRSFTFKLAFATSDYKPNTNSSNNAGGQLYDIRVEGEASKNLLFGAEYLNVDPKYSPFILPFALPSTLTTATFPWGQWPFPVDFQGYYTLHNAQEYPQNRQGAKTFLTFTVPNGKITGSYRWLSQKIATQLSSFNNDVDIQSIGFFEPFFTATGSRSQALPNGISRDWNVTLHYDLRSALALEMLGSGVAAKRFTGDANNVDFSGWLGRVGMIYSFWEKWKMEVGYHIGHTDGRLLAAPTSASNDVMRNTAKTVRLDYTIAPRTDAFFWFENLDHTQVPGSLNFHMIQFLTGVDTTF